ncbi:hypothetical protein GUJ93_ZPchr0004g39027 [Zizania palustris]|uniref:Uncharacterized protein n=1 Tax=Zizania palustris TaxID=103762 RepID=A0A8J5T144_ZIZPA|nr:hypothetical protein GUJ93_ZPchr0004g39027 [Zizania palustris]
MGMEGGSVITRRHDGTTPACGDFRPPESVRLISIEKEHNPALTNGGGFHQINPAVDPLMPLCRGHRAGATMDCYHREGHHRRASSGAVGGLPPSRQELPGGQLLSGESGMARWADVGMQYVCVGLTDKAVPLVSRPHRASSALPC